MLVCAEFLKLWGLCTGCVSFTHKNAVVSFIAWMLVRVMPSCSDVVVEDSSIPVKSLWVQEAVREYSITIERVPRGAMHAHILASPSSAEELKKHLTELNDFRDLELEDAGGDRGIEEEFGTEMRRESQR